MTQTFLPFFFGWVICMFPGFSCFSRSAQNELDDNILIYVHIISECSAQVTSRCNTSEAPSWQCHDVNWSPMQCLSCLLVHVILGSDAEQKFAAERFRPKKAAEVFKVAHEERHGSLVPVFRPHVHQNTLVCRLDCVMVEWQVAHHMQPGRGVIRKQLWQAPGCSNNVTTICDECYPGLRTVVAEVDLEGVQVRGAGCFVSLHDHLWIMYLKIMGGLVMQYL